jgi:hypothetical protein
MTQQTAVEWLYQIFKQREPDKFDWEQAKQMEKKQIVNAVNDSWNMAKHSNFADAQAEQYYNKTYGK